MSRAIGFSTGSLACSDFSAALAALARSTANAVELSALREPELAPLMNALPGLDLSRFDYKSVHAPSAIRDFSEAQLIAMLQPAARLNLPIVIHADLITAPDLWQPLGELVLIENMDKRKLTGRAAWELEPLMNSLPDARMCFDFAHARQVDPTLCEAVTILKQFGHRIAQLHISELNTASRHESLSFTGWAAIEGVADLIPAGAPVILEFAAEPQELDVHIKYARRLFPSATLRFPRVATG